MRHALLILRKDVRHLWPRVVAVLALAAVYACLDAAMPRNAMLALPEMVCGLLLYLADCFLVISVVHEDPLIGDRQFWLTRPYSWRSLLMAKALFIVLFVNLPVLLGQVVALAAAGLSPLHYLPELLLRQTAVAVFLVPCAALAAVTANLVQVVLTALAAYASLFVSIMGWSLRGGGNWLTPGGAAPIMGACRTAILVLASAGVCVFQYSRRDSTKARWLLAGGIIASLLLTAFVPWGTAFALISWRSPAIDPAVARLSMDPVRDRQAWPSDRSSWGGQDLVDDVHLPIQVTGIPPVMEAYSDHITLTIEAPGGESWTSGWDSLNHVYGVTTPKFEGGRLLSDGGGPYWMYANVDHDFFSKYSTTPVHLRATVAFTLLGSPTTTRLTSANRPQPIPGRGFCQFLKTNGLVGVACFAPFQKVAESVVRFQPLPSGDSQEQGSVEGMEGSSGPSSLFTIWERLSGGGGYRPPPAPYAVFFETRQAVAHFQRVLDVKGIRLAEMRQQ